MWDISRGRDDRELRETEGQKEEEERATASSLHLEKNLLSFTVRRQKQAGSLGRQERQTHMMGD